METRGGDFPAYQSFDAFGADSGFGEQDASDEGAQTLAPQRVLRAQFSAFRGRLADGRALRAGGRPRWARAVYWLPWRAHLREHSARERRGGGF